MTIVDYSPDGEHDRAWLRKLLVDPAGDGPIEVEDSPDPQAVEHGEPPRRLPGGR